MQAKTERKNTCSTVVSSAVVVIRRSLSRLLYVAIGRLRGLQFTVGFLGSRRRSVRSSTGLSAMLHAGSQTNGPSTRRSRVAPGIPLAQSALGARPTFPALQWLPRESGTKFESAAERSLNPAGRSEARDDHAGGLGSSNRAYSHYRCIHTEQGCTCWTGTVHTLHTLEYVLYLQCNQRSGRQGRRLTLVWGSCTLVHALQAGAYALYVLLLDV